MGFLNWLSGGDEAQNLDEEESGEEEESEDEEDDAENLDEQDDEQDEEGHGTEESGHENEDNPEELDGREDPTQDGEGSLQDGDKPEKDPAQDGPGSKQDGPNKKDDLGGGKSNLKSGGGGMPAKLKDPWDPLVTMEIAKQGGLPAIPIPYPCPTCKKMSLFLDTWVNNGGRLTILLAYTIIMIIATKTCPTKINDVVQQVHFKCLNYKCADFAFNAKKMKMVPNMTGGQLDKRSWIFSSPFPKMTTQKAMAIQKKVSADKGAKGGGNNNQRSGLGGIAKGLAGGNNKQQGGGGNNYKQGGNSGGAAGISGGLSKGK